MKTNKYIALICVGVLSIQSMTYADWYGETGPNTVFFEPISPNGATNCSQDSDTDTTGPFSPDSFGPNKVLANYSLSGMLAGNAYYMQGIQARVNSEIPGLWIPAGYMPCQRWDTRDPWLSASAIRYSNGQDVSGVSFDPTIYPIVQAGDDGGAGVYEYKIQYRYAPGTLDQIGTWSNWQSLPSPGNSTQTNTTINESNSGFVLDTKTSGNGVGVYEFITQVTDRAGYTSTWSIGTKLYALETGGWYGPNGPNSAYPIHRTSTGANNCPEDAFPDPFGPADEYKGPNYNPNGLTGDFATYSGGYQARVNTGTITPFTLLQVPCQRWDVQKPIIDTFTYSGSWSSGATIKLYFSGADVGGAGIYGYSIQGQYSDDSPEFTTGWSSWKNIASSAGVLTSTGTNSTGSTYTYNTANDFTKFGSARASKNRAYKFRFQFFDRAYNMGKYVEGPVHKLDTTPPKASNMQHNYSHILADANGYLKLDIVDTGSAITATTDMELATDMSNTTSLILLSSSGTYVPVTKSYTLSGMYDYSIVDGSDRVNATASRPYTMKVTKLVDEAGNITNIPGGVSYAYNVYANTLKFNTSQLQSVITTGVADGIDIPMTLSVKDIYGNGIIPSTPINRVLSFSGIVTNNLYLDQAQRIGNTSSFITPPGSSRQSIPLGMGQSIIVSPMQAALTSVGDYTFGIRAYTPTANAYTATEPVSDPSANLQFAQVDISVTDTLAGQQLYTNILGSNKSYIFSPLYTSKIRGDLLDGGFIEGIVQNSKIDIMKNASSTRPNGLPSTPLGFSYSGTDASLFDFSVSSNNPPNIPIGSSPQILNTNPPTIPVSDYPFYSLLSQKASSILQSNSRIFLASHFQYVMDGYPITYNSDIVGKSSYFDPNIHNYGNQVGVKIIGLVASQNRKELIQGQYNQGVSVFDGIAKSQVRDALLQSVSLAVRNISKSSIGTSVTSLTSLPTGLTASGGIIRQSADRSIMYIEGNGQTIDLNMSAIDGVRTLFLKGVNLYIKQDMYYTNNKSILGVYIAKNMNNVGGNLYIDPSVTNIIGAYALEGAMQSYNGVNVLTFSNSNIATLKNQLYLYGTLLSENTLGGSRAAVPKCPSLLNIPTCTQDEAQKYDLNYIRRYYLIDPTLAGGTNAVPFAGGKIIAGGTCDKNTGNCSSFNPMLKQKFTNTSDDLAKNPFIIEYNPTIRSIQPTGFEGILQ